MAIASSPIDGPGAQRWPARLPLLMLVLLLPTLVIAARVTLAVAVGISVSLRDRDSAILRAKAQPLGYDSAFLATPLSRLPPAEVERFALMLGEDRYEQRGVTLPLGLLSLVLCWLLIAGTVATLRRQPYGPALWTWGCLVNIPFAALVMLVIFVRTRALCETIGPKLAESLAALSHRPLAVERDELTQLAQLTTLSWAVLYCLWITWLAASAIYLRRHTPAAAARFE